VTNVRTVLAMRTREGCKQRFEAEWLKSASADRSHDGATR
jgi:hypothetical protein